jgi:hypothetical protein
MVHTEPDVPHNSDRGYYCVFIPPSMLASSPLKLRSNTAVRIVASVYLLTGLNAGLQLTDNALELEKQHSSDNSDFIFT